ncbi:uncharacterized protein [Primulina huaijiensis]|uniref:uncharacterized protein isoform X2 n=1 Tax=Primulina huaijiensis TaxID=1492673 RepID=UPI003CC74A37
MEKSREMVVLPVFMEQNYRACTIPYRSLPTILRRPPPRSSLGSISSPIPSPLSGFALRVTIRWPMYPPKLKNSVKDITGGLEERSRKSQWPA